MTCFAHESRDKPLQLEAATSVRIYGNILYSRYDVWRM